MKLKVQKTKIIALLIGLTLLLSILTLPFSSSIDTPTDINNNADTVIVSDTLQYNTLHFKQMYYYKSPKPNRLRIYTVYIDNIDSLNNEYLTQIKQHGSSQMNTPNNITVTYYFNNESNTPYLNEIPLGDSFYKSPYLIAVVWIMSNGQVNIVEPKDTF